MEFKPGHDGRHRPGHDVLHARPFGRARAIPSPIANDDDEVETPSLILLAESGHVMVGPSRTRAAMEDPRHVVERVKRHMGNAEFKRTFDGREITPEFLSALILKKLRQDAEKRIGKIGNAVITVPYYFNDARRKATRGRRADRRAERDRHHQRADGRHADLRLEAGRTGRRRQAIDKPRLALVYDLGGGTFDVTVVRYTPTPFPGAGHRRRRAPGRHRLERPAASTTWPRSSRPSTASTRASRPPRCRCCATTATRPRSRCPTRRKATITCRHEGKALTVPITREQFEDMTADLLQRTIDTAELVLEQAERHGRASSTRSCWWAARR